MPSPETEHSKVSGFFLMKNFTKKIILSLGEFLTLEVAVAQMYCY